MTGPMMSHSERTERRAAATPAREPSRFAARRLHSTPGKFVSHRCNPPAANRDGSRAGGGVAARRFSLLLALILMAGTSRVFAHDPYEISSTVRIETNRTLIEIEMEFNGAMLLVGEPRSREPVDQPALFQSKLPELRQQAGQFFEVSGAGVALAATGTNVTLGVENHVRFNLEYPAARDGLKLNAAGLKLLSEHGPFGTTVTVLDMVNLKVLGQPVLFAESPVAEFAPAMKAEPVAVQPKPDPLATSSAPVPATPAAPAPTAPAPCCNGRWVLVLAVLLGVFVIWVIRRKR